MVARFFGSLAIAFSMGIVCVLAQAVVAEEPNVEWNQWGGSAVRNNTPVGHNIPTEWNVGRFDYRTGEWDPTGSKNILWVARLGSQSYGNPVVADGKVFVGTNNSGGWLDRYPPNIDLGCLLAFDAKTGKFLWQHSNEKLPTGRVHDWPLQGVCSARSWRETDCGTSPIAASSAASTPKALTTAKTTARIRMKRSRLRARRTSCGSTT